MKIASIFCLLVCLLTLSPGSTKQSLGRQTTPSSEQLAAIARNHLDSLSRPPFKIDPNDVAHVYDRGDKWIITFMSPNATIGGGPTVEIDKRTLKPIKAYITQ